MTRTLGWLSVVALVLALFMTFVIAPREITQGNVQRIMYLHVPMAIIAEYIACSILLVASVLYLWRRSEAVDRVAHAAAEVGAVFTALTIATGSIWGKPTWGTWWTWDARLTSMAILFVIYLGYLLVRGMIDDPDRAARYAAVVGIVGAFDAPIVHFSVLWWRTLHQPPSIGRPGMSAMAPSIVTALLVNFVAFTILYCYFVAKRARQLRCEQEALA